MEIQDHLQSDNQGYLSKDAIQLIQISEGQDMLSKMDKEEIDQFYKPFEKIKEDIKKQEEFKSEQSSVQYQKDSSKDSETWNIEEFIQKIGKKQAEIEGKEDSQLLIEFTQLIDETKDDRVNQIRAYKLIALYISFYNLWKDAEIILKWSEQYEMSNATKKPNIDVYDCILEIMESKQIMSGILFLLCQGSKQNNAIFTYSKEQSKVKKEEMSREKNNTSYFAQQKQDKRISNIELTSKIPSQKIKGDMKSIPEEQKKQEKELEEDLDSKNKQECFIQNHQIFSNEKESQNQVQQEEGSFIKEYLLTNLIQTFNIRMNVVNDTVNEWLIENQKLNIIELLLENGRLCTSSKRKNYEEMKKSEKRMLNYFQEYLVSQNKFYSNEIELLLNLNENGLQILSMYYIRYLIKYIKIPPNYIVNRSLISEAVSLQNIPLISQMIRYSRQITQETLHSQKVQLKVREFLFHSETFSIGLYFLKKMSQKRQRLSTSSDYFEDILRLLQRPQVDEQFALECTQHCLHPLVLCIICSKILLKLSMGKNPFSSEMLKLSNFYLQRSLVYRDAIFDAREMSLLLFKPLFPSDKPLVKALRSEKYAAYFTDFFVHPCITYLLEQKFKSTYGWDKIIFGALTPFAHLQNHSKIKNPYNKKQISSSSSYQKSNKSESVDMSEKRQSLNIFKEIELSSLEKLTKNNHIFSYVITNKSVAVRMAIELGVFIFLVGYTMKYLFTFIENFNNFYVSDSETKELMFDQIVPSSMLDTIIEYGKTHEMPSQSTDQNPSYSIFNTNPSELCLFVLTSMSYGEPNFMNYFYENCIIVVETGIIFETSIRAVIISCYLLIILGANVFIKQLYSYLIRKKASLTVLDYYDLLISIAGLTIIVVKQNFIPDGITGGYTLEYFTFYTNIIKYEGCFLVFLLWIKLFLFLIRSQKIGILVKIILLFINDLSQFIIILITVLIAFGTLNYILFQNQLKMYATYMLSIFNLIAAAFGAFDFSGQNYIQSFILIIFLFVVNIVLMNLLIAILNSRYEKTMLRSEMEYSLVVYNDYINLRYHPLYSCMISLAPPLNAVSMLFTIPAIILKSRKWNEFVLKIEYTLFILLPISFIFIAVSIFCLPLSYIYLLIKIFGYNISDNMMNIRKSRLIYKISLNFFKCFQWIIFGIPYLIIVFFINDLPLFFKSAFIHINNKYTFTPNKILDLRVIRYGSLTSNYLHSAKNQVLNFIDFRSSLENKKQARNKNEGTVISKFGRTQIPGQTKQFQQLKQATTFLKSNNQPEQFFEKNFDSALKKFGDGKFRSESECIYLPYLLKSIKFSAIFFRRSKTTALNISRLLFVARKKDQFHILLTQNPSTVFLSKSYSSFSNISNSPQM